MLTYLIVKVNHLVFKILHRIIEILAFQIKILAQLFCYSLRYSGLALILLIPFFASSQQQVSLNDCYQSLETNFPLVNQKEKLQQAADLAIKNLETNYLPSLNLKLKASYQSEVTSISLSIPGLTVPEVPKDQYGASLELSQVIYDGGNTKAAKILSQQSNVVDMQKVNVDVYQLKSQLNQLFYSCLLMQENSTIIDLTKETIKERRKVLESAVLQGIVNVSELDRLDAEFIKLEQQGMELNSGITQALAALSELSCMPITNDAKLTIDVAVIPEETQYNRPENILFQNQISMLEASANLTGKKRMPTLGAFANAGYGKPGYDMFNADMHGYYMVGAQLQWTIWDWKKTKREQAQINLKKQIVTDSEQAFNINLNIALCNTKLKYENLKTLIEKDKEVIALQTKISKRSSQQLENGICTTADYIRDLNAEKQARINLKVREIQVAQTLTEMNFIVGKSQSK
jgi:outer membrane protein TolC